MAERMVRNRLRPGFPRLVLTESGHVIAMDARWTGMSWLRRKQPCGHPRWPQWWVPFRRSHTWELTPSGDDAHLLDHYTGGAEFHMVPPPGCAAVVVRGPARLLYRED